MATVAPEGAMVESAATSASDPSSRAHPGSVDDMCDTAWCARYASSISIP
jgi:hypothetical protein